MKILDELRAYNGRLTYLELVELVIKVNDRVNTQINQGTGRIPLLYFKKEKTFLHNLPADNVRKPYQITTNTVKVNHSSMFNYRECQYSVPPEYVGKTVALQLYDDYIHIYYSTKLVTIHHVSSRKLNYIEDLICKTNFHPYMTCRGSYYFRISGVEITYS